MLIAYSGMFRAPEKLIDYKNNLTTKTKIMETLDLRFISEENDLEYIETTSARNGYPQSIQGAVIGFDTFEEAKNFASENDLEIQFFEKKDGWNLWYRNGNTAYEEMTISSNDYGDDYSEIYSSQFNDEEDFIEEEVNEQMSELLSFEDIESFLNDKKDLWEEIEKMEEDEIIITCCGDFYETLKKERMRFSHCTRTTAIGCI